MAVDKLQILHILRYFINVYFINHSSGGPKVGEIVTPSQSINAVKSTSQKLDDCCMYEAPAKRRVVVWNPTLTSEYVAHAYDSCHAIDMLHQ